MEASKEHVENAKKDVQEAEAKVEHAKKEAAMALQKLEKCEAEELKPLYKATALSAQEALKDAQKFLSARLNLLINEEAEVAAKRRRLTAAEEMSEAP